MEGQSDEVQPSSGWRIALKGLSDTFENLLPFTIASLLWWLSLFSVLFAPAATQRLFRITDPRIVSSIDRPSMSRAFRHPFTGAGPAWWLMFIIGVPVLVLLSNLRYYAAEVNGWTLLIPLWLFVLVSLLLIGVVAFSIQSLFDAPTGQCLRHAAALCFGQPRRIATMLIIAIPVSLLCIVVVIPAFTLLPAALSAMTNRFVLSSLAIPVIDPLAPTGERRLEESIEQSRAESARRFGP